ncbi:GNAT family N-acetyltransferase [Pseudomonas fontis]|uniref:GNAT family N-acetyltransferase n=1 Tax=Pseudomonas fontis TaxID=2942633 RepID=A0ABT5NYX5_9PSED|nr:GNAT family N-acetyltransferase [Pseudomonas fontis]MDD0977132.1 GNAT family N-acetyltransferase [Pseudomonas fontis]MDD0993395.1 GNAT family N-acetyltransferase [Pseudomonas fontis]
MTIPGLSFRPTSQGDMAFLQHLYATTRAAEMSHSGWPAAQIDEFLTQQFNAQHQYYQAHFPDGEFWLIEREGQAIGRLYLFWGKTALNLIDIALLPACCGQGLGSRIIQTLVQRAHACGLAIELSVEYYNPAQRLYARLGFLPIADSGVYRRLRREAATPELLAVEA